MGPGHPRGRAKRELLPPERALGPWLSPSLQNPCLTAFARPRACCLDLGFDRNSLKKLRARGCFAPGCEQVHFCTAAPRGNRAGLFNSSNSPPALGVTPPALAGPLSVVTSSFHGHPVTAHPRDSAPFWISAPPIRERCARTPKSPATALRNPPRGSDLAWGPLLTARTAGTGSPFPFCFFFFPFCSTN